MRLIFINFAIDNLWDETGALRTLFPMRIPQSERIVRAHEDLGAFLANAGDFVLMANPLTDLAWQPTATLLPIAANPYDQDRWLAEVLAKIPKDQRLELWPCGISSLEAQLLQQCPNIGLPKWIDPNFNFAQWNRKTRIIEWSSVSGLAIPATQILTTDQLLTGQWQNELKWPMVVKADFGSGGGGNIRLHSPASENLKVLRRQLRDFRTGLWLLQEWSEAAQNFSIFGWANQPVTPTLMQINYDQNGLSNCHQLVAMSPRFMALKDAFARVAGELSQAGYGGPFGLDIIADPGEESCKLLDVNVRFTKSHLIVAAAEKLNIDLSTHLSRRFRLRASDLRSAEETSLSLLSDANVQITRYFGRLNFNECDGPQEVSIFSRPDFSVDQAYAERTHL